MSKLTDKLGREIKDLRISVIDACNFRCPYCMPAAIFDHYEFLKKDELLSFEEINRLVKHFVSFGVEKIRLTGGEPLLRKNLEKLIEMLAMIPGIKDLALTTNGYLLAEKAQSLKDAGLMRVTVSLDALDEEKFKKMAGRDVKLERVLKGIEVAKEVGLGPIKINTVVKRNGNEEQIVPLARYFKGSDVTVRYIEYMDVGSANGWNLHHVLTLDEITQMINKEFPLESVYEEIESSDVAKRFHYKDNTGEIGVVSSVSKPFCRSCVRARLSAEGKFYTCLFATEGTDLRTPLRSDLTEEQMAAFLSNIWANRSDRYSELRQMLPPENIEQTVKRVEMFKMGG
ncbi:MAG TPA: GTP 3',8-cyclase MoaA [Legionella sp.]|nr:GTP 3',8-cyclase MoaA [Legionella sp.]